MGDIQLACTIPHCVRCVIDARKEEVPGHGSPRESGKMDQIYNVAENALIPCNTFLTLKAQHSLFIETYRGFHDKRVVIKPTNKTFFKPSVDKTPLTKRLLLNFH